MIPVETPAIHPHEYETVHKAFLSKGFIIVEGLANLDSVESRDTFFVALPLKLKGLGASLVRAVAMQGDFGG